MRMYTDDEIYFSCIHSSVPSSCSAVHHTVQMTIPEPLTLLSQITLTEYDLHFYWPTNALNCINLKKVKIYTYQYFKRQLKTMTCFRSFGIHPQGVLSVLHWNYLWCFVCVVGVWQREIWICGVCVWCDELRKTSQVISVKHTQYSLRMDPKGSETCRSFCLLKYWYV